MRDYYKYYVAYETYDTSSFSDTPQWNAFSSNDEAQNNGMSPIFPDGTIAVTPAWLRIKGQAQFVAFANGTRTLGFFANQFNPKLKGAGFNGFWYLQDDLREMGYNSKTAEAKDRPLISGKSDLSGAGALLAFLNSLIDTAAKLKKAGLVREAGIVTFAYNQVINLNFTIMDAIRYLIRNLPSIFG